MISIIIPTFNEQENIASLISYLKKHSDPEIIITDGGSSDGTLDEAKFSGVKIVKSKKGRANQMNAGAKHAKGEIVYFLHADTYPPIDYEKQITLSFKKGYYSGCFKRKMNHSHWFLRLICYLADQSSIFAYGDSSLYVSKEVFWKINGFKESMDVMEDVDIVRRLKKVSRFKIIDKYVNTSARKFLDNGIYKLSIIFCLLLLMYYLGFSEKNIKKAYTKLIR